MHLPSLHHFRRNLELYRIGKDASFGMIIYQWKSAQPVFLLIKHRQGHWDFPKGHPEGSELPIETAIREAAEEVGLSGLKPTKNKTFEEIYQFRIWGKKISKSVTFWLAEVVNPEVQIQPSEIAEYKWATATEGLQLITFDAGKQLLTQAQQYLQSRESS